MKVSTIMAVFAVALAVTTSGCRYGKSSGGNTIGDEGAANVSDIPTEAVAGAGADVSNIDVTAVDGGDAVADTTSLDAALTSGRMFDEMYGRCNDANYAPVYFGFDSTVVPAGELGKIDAVAQHLADNANRVVIVEGNCDERGSNEYNMSLGQSRAEIVRNYLVQSGVASDRIQTRSNGEEKPAAEGHDESAWALNRRGDFLIFQK